MKYKTQRAQLERDGLILAVVIRQEGEEGKNLNQRIVSAMNKHNPSQIKLMGVNVKGEVKHETVVFDRFE